MARKPTREESFNKVNKLIKNIRIAMLTTVDVDGSLRSRPMATQKTPFDGTLWFFTDARSHKVDEVNADAHVNVAYADVDDNAYVSVSGAARLVRDPAKAKELWKPALRAWFPDGLKDPNLALLKVKVTSIEYWDSPNSTMVMLYGVAKATLTGKRPHPGDHAELEIHNARERHDNPDRNGGNRPKRAVERKNHKPPIS